MFSYLGADFGVQDLVPRSDIVVDGNFDAVFEPVKDEDIRVDLTRVNNVLSYGDWSKSQSLIAQ